MEKISRRGLFRLGALTVLLAGCRQSPDQEVTAILPATSKDPVYFSHGAVLNSDPRLKIRVDRLSMQEIISYLPEIFLTDKKYVLIITGLNPFTSRPSDYRGLMPNELRGRIISTLRKPNDPQGFDTLFVHTDDAVRNVVGFSQTSRLNQLNRLSVMLSVGVYYNLKRNDALLNNRPEPTQHIPIELAELFTRRPAIVVTEIAE